MLRNDRVRDIRMDSVHTRDLCRVVEQHHKNNPQSSMEDAFEYIMLNSSTFRALPTACIEKARKYLALPETDPDKALQNLSDVDIFPIFIIPVGPTDSKGMTPIKWECNGLPPTDLKDILESMGVPSSNEKGDQNVPGISIPRLNKDRLTEFINRVMRNASTHESIGHTFGRIRRESAEFMQMHPIDIHNAWTRLTEMQANEPKPSTTVVHAERVVVDNKKMVKILKFANVMNFGELPIEYKSSFPSFHESGSGIALLVKSGEFAKVTVIYTGDTMSPKHFDQMIKTMKEAAARLSKINKTAKLEREHSGKFTVSI